MSEYPASKFERSSRIAKAGLKVGTNYAKHYLKKTLKGKKEGDDAELKSLHSKNAKALFDDFAKLRGTALKIAQALSMEKGILPDEFTDVFTQAQYSVPPINKSLARSIIKNELGEYPETLFESFSADAIAAASIGQVHKAKLKDGRDVAVKIQYPNVRNTIQSDLGVAKMVFSRFVKGSLDEYFGEVHDRLMEETDYEHEGNQINLFHERFNGDKYAIPEWLPEYSTKKVLAMTFLEGKHLDAYLKTEPSQQERNHFGQLLWDFFHVQIEKGQPIHADTHPGNFLFLPDGRLGVIDFGCVKSFPDDFFESYMKLLPIHLHGTDEEIAELYVELGILKNSDLNDEKERTFFEFSKEYGMKFAEVYKQERFDFGDETYQKRLKSYGKNFPKTNEPRGSKHFIYSTRVHLGLFNLLMDLEAVVETSKSIGVINETLDELELPRV